LVQPKRGVFRRGERKILRVREKKKAPLTRVLRLGGKGKGSLDSFRGKERARSKKQPATVKLGV